MLLEVQYCQQDYYQIQGASTLNMTNEDEQMFKTAVECHICGQQYPG